MAVLDPNALWGQAASDSSVVAGKSGLKNALINAALNYGDASSLFAPGSATDPATGLPTTLAALYGIQQSDVAAASQNPDSTIALNGQTTTKDNQTNENNVAARGLEFSGAKAALDQNEAQAAQARNYTAQQGLGSTISGINQQYGGLITGAYNTLMTNALNDPTIPAAAPPPSDAGAAPLPPISTIGPTNFTGDPRTGPSLYAPIAPKVPKVKLPAIGGMGHIT